MPRSRASSCAFVVCVCALLVSSPRLRAGAEDRPMAATCDTTFAFTGPTSAQVLGTCQFRHLGLTTAVADQTIIFTGPTTLSITNTVVYTAANGDELHSSFAGTGTIGPAGVTFVGVETFSGGTGRFAHASGSMVDRGTAAFSSPATGVGQFTGDGTIVY